MKVVTAEEMQRIDKITIEEIGIPGEVLMGHAGKAVADQILADFPHLESAAIFSGTGNNGGDGFVVAYFLSNKGIKIDLFIAGDKSKITKTSEVYFNSVIRSNINIIDLDEKSLEQLELDKYDLIIDALLGTGFKGKPRGIVKDTIIKINSSSAKVVSIDLPSGLPSDGEAPESQAVMADYTVTIGLPKISLVTYPGKKYTGILHIADIGFPTELTNSDDLQVNLLDSEYVSVNLDLEKDADSHKGKAGHLLIIGGFDNMEGAAIMSATAAFETGVGLATLITTPKARNIIAGKIPELITRTIDSFDNEKTGSYIINDIIQKNLKNFFSEDRHYNVLLIGPGMGRSEISAKIFNTVIGNLSITGITKVLIDGDGLYHLSEYLKIKKLPADISFVLTPHFSEASRLLGKTIDEIKNNRLSAAKELSKITSSVVVLKGPATIITDGEKSLINTTGNPALGTAGTGDILSGIIGSMLLKEISSLNAAGIGVFIHGLTADVLLNEYDTPVLKATDLIDYIRIAIADVSNHS